MRMGGRADRQAHGKDRTFAWFARDDHIAAHHARELAGDGEAETGAAELRPCRDAITPSAGTPNATN